MSSVDSMLQVKQPRGSYLPTSLFEPEAFYDGKAVEIRDTRLLPIVSCLTKVVFGNTRSEIVSVPLEHAVVADGYTSDVIHELANSVSGLEDSSITAVAKLSAIYSALMLDNRVSVIQNDFDGFEISYPAVDGQHMVNLRAHMPTDAELTSIRVLVERCLSFFGDHGPVVKAGFSFGDGYFGVVDRGEGDILTTDGLWDIETFRSRMEYGHSLRLLMNWILACSSSDADLNGVLDIGIFNPLVNISYTMHSSQVPLKSIELVKERVFLV